MGWIQVIDVIFCTLLLRFLMGWLLSNRQVARFVLSILSLAIFVMIVNQLDLPLTKTLTSALRPGSIVTRAFGIPSFNSFVGP